jgi:Tfp pilus assembly protein PilF
VLGGTAVVVIAAVPVRNLAVAGEPVLFTAHSGINFYYANNPEADGTWRPAGELDRGTGFSHRRLKRTARVIDGTRLSWTRSSSHWMREGFAFILGQPGRFAWLVGRKLLLFLGNYEVPNNYYPETAREASTSLRLAFIPFGLVLACAVVGMVRGWRYRRKAWPAYLLVAGFLFSSLAFYVLSRLRAPVIPFLLVFAGFGLSATIAAARHRNWHTTGVNIAIAAAVFTLSLLVPADRATYSSQAWAQLGNAWLERKSIKPAMEALERSLAHNPGNPSARYSLVLALAGMGKKAEAEAEARRLAASAASDPGSEVLAEMAAARVAIAHRDFAGAARRYRGVLAREPDHAEAHYLLGLVYISTDSIALSRGSLAAAVALDPTNAAAREALAMVEARLARGPGH